MGKQFGIAAAKKRYYRVRFFTDPACRERFVQEWHYGTWEDVSVYCNRQMARYAYTGVAIS